MAYHYHSFSYLISRTETPEEEMLNKLCNKTYWPLGDFSLTNSHLVPGQSPANWRSGGQALHLRVGTGGGAESVDWLVHVEAGAVYWLQQSFATQSQNSCKFIEEEDQWTCYLKPWFTKLNTRTQSAIFWFLSKYLCLVKTRKTLYSSWQCQANQIFQW